MSTAEEILARARAAAEPSAEVRARVGWALKSTLAHPLSVPSGEAAGTTSTPDASATGPTGLGGSPAGGSPVGGSAVGGSAGGGSAVGTSAVGTSAVGASAVGSSIWGTYVTIAVVAVGIGLGAGLGISKVSSSEAPTHTSSVSLPEGTPTPSPVAAPAPLGRPHVVLEDLPLDSEALATEVTPHERHAFVQEPTPEQTNAQPRHVETEAPSAKDPLLFVVTRLQRAQAELKKGRPVQALVLLDELDDAYPSDVLLEERSAVRVHARCAASHSPSSVLAARKFLLAHPTSLYAERIREACRIE